MELLDGKLVKKELMEEIKNALQDIERPLGLAVLQVGDDEASNVYIGQKNKMAKELGFDFRHFKLDENISEKDLIGIIEKLNKDEKIDGILVQMPIPKHLNSKTIQNSICYYKDVDGLTDINAGALMHNEEGLVPCTPEGIMDLLKYYKISVEGKNVTIVGRSDLVGKPLANLMTNNKRFRGPSYDFIFLLFINIS